MATLGASGITPYELYKHVHLSEVGTAIGRGTGGVISIAKMFKDKKEVQNARLLSNHSRSPATPFSPAKQRS